MRLNMEFGELYSMPQKEVYDKGYSVGYEDALNDVAAEVAQARVDFNGNGHTTLKNRLDADFNDLQNQITTNNTKIDTEVGGIKEDLVDLKDEVIEAKLFKKQPIVTSIGHKTISSNGYLVNNKNYDAYAVDMNGLDSVKVNKANIFGFFNEITENDCVATDNTRHFWGDVVNCVISTNAKYIVCCNLSTAGIVVEAENSSTEKTLGEEIENIETEISTINESIENKTVYNAISLTDSVIEKVSGKMLRYDKDLDTSSAVDYYIIPVSVGDVYRITNSIKSAVALYVFMDSDKTITYAYPTVAQSSTLTSVTKEITIPDDVSYIAINDIKRWLGVSPVVEKVESVSKIKPSALPNNIISSLLYGRHLVTAGDSITEGATAGEGLPINSRPTYGKLASDYYGCTYTNIGMSGRTMADIHVNGVTRNGFAVDRYTLVPDDTDILTIWFGWNDAAYGANSMRDDYCVSTYGSIYNSCTTEQKAEANTHDWDTAFLGDVESTDKKTWCGAWNFVLNYFTVTKHIKRFGVIIPFLPLGIFYASMRSLLVELCQRYGVSYIDSANPNEIPTVCYCDSSRSTNYVNYLTYRTAYTADTLHPNAEGYERISRGYIPWIARI